jgi:ParB family chromosome partitioning protein
MSNTEIVFFPYGKLQRSPFNVRVVNPKDEADQQLLASIREIGLLQNLVVHPEDNTDVMFVCGGGRRLSCLDILFKDGDINEEFQVPCKVQKKEDAVIASLSENMKEGMHPADEFMAYQAMSEQGLSREEIAKKTGNSLHRVKRLLKLGSLAPKLIEEYREGNIGYDSLVALTLSESHEEQVNCFTELHPHRLSAHHIRGMLLGNAIKSSEGLVKFIGLDAYKKAGGQVAQDLFNDVDHLEDRDLVEKLAIEKLEGLKDDLMKEGWKWGEVYLSNPYDFNTPQLKPSDKNVPEALLKKLEKLEGEMDAIHEADEFDSEKENEIDDKINATEDEIESLKSFSDEQKSCSGFYLFVDREGEVVADKGYVKKADMAEAFPSEAGSNGGVTAGAQNEEQPIESQALRSDLKNYEQQALQAELMNHESLCHDLLQFSLAEEVLRPMEWQKGLDIRATPADLSATGDIHTTEAAKAIESKKEKLDLTWVKSSSQAKRFEAFQALTRPAKRKIVAYCTALLTTQMNGVLMKNVRKQCDFQLGEYWQPTAENYFSRIKKGVILDIAKGRLGAEWVEVNGNQKKGDLAKAVANEPDMKGWYPDCFK